MHRDGKRKLEITRETDGGLSRFGPGHELLPHAGRYFLREVVVHGRRRLFALEVPPPSET